MGNSCGKCSTNDIFKPESTNNQAAPAQHGQRASFFPDLNDVLDHVQKVKIAYYIRRNDAYGVKTYLKKYNSSVNENIGKIGYGQTTLHFAARYNCDDAMRALVEYTKEVEPQRLSFYLGLADAQGNTPAMVCAMRDSPDALLVLLDSEERTNMSYKNKENQTLEDIAKANSINCLNIINYKLGREQVEPAQVPEHAKALDQKELENLQAQIREKMAEELKKKSELAQLSVQERKYAYVQLEVIDVAKQEEDLRKEQAKAQRTAEDIINACRAKARKTIAEIPIKYKEILSTYESTGSGNYTDPEFPAHLASICRDQSHEYYNSHFSTAVWLRPHEIFKVRDYSDVKLFDEIEPNDVSQGLLGVCYFLSSISALAEYPSRLMKIFNMEQGNPHGVYSVTFFDTGVPKEVIVDDRFPCNKRGGALFSKPKGKELWVLVLEKAWAKLYGDYVTTEAGFMAEALEALVGAPNDQVDVTEQTTPDKIWADFSAWDRERYIMTCATKNDVDQNSTGLVPGHAYTVIGAYRAGNHRILKIRNPWGKFEWTGNFSDNSPMWTDELKRALGYECNDDGVFYMTVEDFIIHMDYYSNCYFRDTFQRRYQEVETHKRHAEYFEFDIERPTLTSIQLLQKNKRHHANDSGYDYSPIEIILLKKEANGGYKTISANPGYWGKRDYSLREETSDFILLEPGSYVLRTKANWHRGQQDKFTLISYAENEIDLQKVDRANHKDFLKHFLMSTAQHDKGNTDMGNRCSFRSGWDNTYMYCYAKNEGHGTMNLDVKLTRSSNLRIPRKFQKDANSFTIVVPPQSEEIMYLKKIDRCGGGSISWSFSNKYHN